ncbi:MAG: ddl, D-alanyl-alanine synthetase D-alanine-D-alanine ligase [Candidatus Berkelbacteria bacterium]|nr:ddl, D-alanyl-alanine synthetase D-alanine-D-alanine ligase [Candidatus Berkelbacteria bacterium]
MSQPRIKVAVLYGGVSAEHEVSIVSANSVMENLDKEKFEVIPIKISKDGKFDERKIKSSDIVFPVLHGVGGEDGSLQGYCETVGKPYVGSGVEASALALDKVASKQIWQNLGLPIPSFTFFTKDEWQKNSTQIMRKIIPQVFTSEARRFASKMRLEGSANFLPIFVKPANTGSSIGVTKVREKSQIKRAIAEALKYHDKIIIEEALENIREIEVSVLGNSELIISVPGEILPAEEFYTYDAKYKLDSGLVYPAIISDGKTKEIQKIAEVAYRVLGCRGFARVDLFMKKDEGKIFLNEINTIPGFTKISMYPKLMEVSGISYKELLTKIINLALE